MSGTGPANQTPPTGKKLHIVIVDDLLQMRDIVKQSLGREGHAVESFRDGESALAYIKKNLEAVDLFISDHHMPKMNGLEVVHELRKTPYQGRVFIFSSEIDHDVNDAYLELKVDTVLPKPIILPELKQLLAEFWPPAKA